MLQTSDLRFAQVDDVEVIGFVKELAARDNAVAVAVALTKAGPREFWFHFGELEIGPPDDRHRVKWIENLVTASGIRSNGAASGCASIRIRTPPCCSAASREGRAVNVAPEIKVEAQVESDELWFKDAIVYQLHVKAFADSNSDGVGDFAGLTSKLDYLRISVSPRSGYSPSTRLRVATMAMTFRTIVTSIPISARCRIFAALCRRPSAESCG